VQNMSDRNMAETLMANGGQRFAAGGISNIQRMAAGGVPKYTYDPITDKYTQVNDVISSISSDNVPKYTYDPITQRYTLDTSTAEKKKEEGTTPAEGSGTDAIAPNAFGLLSPGERAAYYAENPNMGAVTRGIQGLFANTSLGMAQNFLDPSIQPNATLETRGIDPGAFGLSRSDNENPGQTPGPTSYQSGVGNPAEGGGGNPTGDRDFGGGSTDAAGRDSDGTPLARGGLAALAQGGMSNLGDYSDGGRLLRGPGDGVSDSIPATIANKQPARLADGEFVVPARIVSELGNGSTEAGARKLYQMLARVQNARKKSIGQGRVAVNSRADKMLPA